MDNPTSTPTSTSSLPPQDPPLPTATDQPAMLDANLPSLATDLNTSPALPTPAAVTQPPLAAQVPTDPSSKGRKRALERNLQIDNSNYYKMRLLLKDLRPHVLEILRAPDFRNCKGAIEIQEKMKLMLQLYQEMIGDTPKAEKIAKTESLSNGMTINQTTLPQSATATSNLQTEKLNSNGDGDKVRDSMVGGSAFGWNFVTYGGTEAVYCGISKEEYRSSHPIIQVEAEVDLHKTV